MKINKKLILMLILVLTTSVLSGCDGKSVSFEGVNNKAFEKDANKLAILILESLVAKKYDDKIDDFVDKMNSREYIVDLNETEVDYLASINHAIPLLKEDLSTGSKIAQSTTLSYIEWMLQSESVK